MHACVLPPCLLHEGVSDISMTVFNHVTCAKWVWVTVSVIAAEKCQPDFPFGQISGSRRANSSTRATTGCLGWVGVGADFSRCPLCSTELSPICPPLNICCGSAAPLRRGECGLWLAWKSRNPSTGWFPSSPVGNWHIPLLIIKVTWHMYSQRWADLHCRHIPQLGVTARCPFEASLCLRWLKIPSCYIFQGQ